MGVCEDPSYRCPTWGTINLKTGTSSISTMNVTEKREVITSINNTQIILQKRIRSFNYSGSESDKIIANKAFYMSEQYYEKCITGSDSTFNTSFSDIYETVDSEIMYLDLRNDTAVIKEVSDRMEATPENMANMPGDKVRVFTGYETVNYHPVMFDTIPIKQTVRYYLLLNNNSTELHREQINRGSDNAYLLMLTFPVSSFGISIVTPWAQDIDWYRSDLYEEQDGNRYLFWAPWHRQCGLLNQTLDKLNRDIIYQLNHGQRNINRENVYPDIVTESVFYGSIAYDSNKNIFYSMAIPDSVLTTNPNYIYKQQLIVDNKEKNIPTDGETNIWYPIAPY